jgi:ribonuclease D
MTTTSLNESLDAARHPILLETPAQLSEAEKSWNGKHLIGIDTEFVRERTYRARLGLVQVSDGQTAWLVDTVKLHDLEALARLLADRSVIKVLHSGSEDLEVLLHQVGVVPEPLFDTQVACAMLGQPLQMGYHAAVNWLLGVEVDKEQTRSNWCRRPLTAQQLHYAAMDVVLLPSMYALLNPRLDEMGRQGWLEEDVARAARNAHEDVSPEEAYLRIGSASRMDEPSLRALRLLAEWREHTAREKNLARGFIIADAGLANLARERPRHISEARELEGIHPKALERYGDKLLSLLARAAGDETPLRRLPRLDNSQRKQVDRMRARVQQRAAELGVESALLASRRELENLLRAVTERRDPPERFDGWRRQVITDDLLGLIG